MKAAASSRRWLASSSTTTTMPTIWATRSTAPCDRTTCRLEVLVVDDGSTDRSRDVIAWLWTEDSLDSQAEWRSSVRAKCRICCKSGRHNSFPRLRRFVIAFRREKLRCGRSAKPESRTCAGRCGLLILRETSREEPGRRCRPAKATFASSFLTAGRQTAKLADIRQRMGAIISAMRVSDT